MPRRWPILCVAPAALLATVVVSRVVGAARLESGLAWARLEMDAGRFREPGIWLRNHVESSADHPEVAYWLGICEQVEGRHAGAIAAWSLVPPRSTLAGRAALAQAQVLVGDLGRFAEAEPRLGEAIRSPGAEAIEARHALSQLNFWEGRTGEMRRLIEEGFDRLPDPASELRDLWRIDNASVSIEDVREAVDIASKRAPDDDRVWLARAYLATIGGRYSEAGRLLDSCLDRRPDDPAVWRGRLRWALAADRADEVRRALPKIPGSSSSLAEASEIRARLARLVGDRGAERDALEALIALDPGRPGPFGRLSALASLEGREDRAEGFRRRLAEVNRLTVRYQQILAEPAIPASSFPELSRLAESLGRHFEARGWRALASRAPTIDEDLREALDRDRNRPPAPSIPPGSTLADLVGRDGSVKVAIPRR